MDEVHLLSLLYKLLLLKMELTLHLSQLRAHLLEVNFQLLVLLVEAVYL